MPIFVNQTEITDEEVFREMQYHPAASQDVALEEAARSLTIRELLRQESLEQQLVDDGAGLEDVDAAIMKLIEKEVQAPEAETQMCRRYYEQNKDRFRTGPDAAAQPFELVEDKIREYLHTRSIRHGIQSYILDLITRHKVAGFDLAAIL